MDLQSVMDHVLLLERLENQLIVWILPSFSRIHPVLHVSRLKQCVAPHNQVQLVLPPPDALLRENASACTWEDLDSCASSSSNSGLGSSRYSRRGDFQRRNLQFK